MALSQRPAALRRSASRQARRRGGRSRRGTWSPTATTRSAPTSLRAMAARIHPRKTVEVKGASHVVMISRPERTTDLILEATRSATDHVAHRSTPSASRRSSAWSCSRCP